MENDLIFKEVLYLIELLGVNRTLKEIQSIRENFNESKTNRIINLWKKYYELPDKYNIKNKYTDQRKVLIFLLKTHCNLSLKEISLIIKMERSNVSKYYKQISNITPIDEYSKRIELDVTILTDKIINDGRQ